MKQESIYFRLFRSFLAASLIPVLCLAALTLLFTRQYSMNKMKDELLLVTDGAAGILQRELKKYEENMQLFVGYDGIADFVRNPAVSAGEIIQLNQKMYLITGGRFQSVHLHLVGTDGTILHSTSGQTGLPDNAYSYWGVLRELQESGSSVIYSGAYGSDEFGITIAVPVRYEEDVVGYAMLCITENAFARALSSHHTQHPLQYLITDANHYLVMNQITGQEDMFLPLEYRDIMQPGFCTEYEADGDQKLLAAASVGGTGLMVAATMSVGLVVSSSRSLTVFIAVMCFAVLVIALITSRKLAASEVQPIQVICDTIHQIEENDLNARVPELKEDELGTLARGFNMMLDQLQEQFRTNLERQDRLRIAEYKNLQAQISPHFLYNTLESIKYLARLGMNDEIEVIVSKLGILLRSGMNFKQDMIPLRDELRVVESYIAIQQIRYQGKFTYTSDIRPELMDCMVPNLVIQPLVENAVVHGIEAKVGSGELKLTGWQENGQVFFEIYDNGDGISPEKLQQIFREETPAGEKPDRERIGIRNVHRRLQLYFGEPYGLEIESQPGQYTRIRLNIPKVEGGNHHVQSGSR